MDRKNFLGYPVDSLDLSDALNWMEDRIKLDTPSNISVINANKLWLMSKNPRLADYMRNSDLVIPEWAVYWGASKIGTPLKSPVYGVVLMKETLPWAEKKGFRPFFLGAKPEVVTALLNKLRSDYPDLHVAGAHHGYFRSQQENEQVVNQIRFSKPDVLFVALGSPRQEYWIQSNLPRIGVPVVMGVGGSLDVVAGLKRDTPNWARGHGLEWLYRLSQDPRAYWKRYVITNPWFVLQVYKARFLLKPTKPLTEDS